MKKQDIFDTKLDEEEQEISNALDQALESGKLKSTSHVAKKIFETRQIATDTLRKDARVNVRISSNDLNRLKRRAAFKGLPYQTFIASVLHEYAAGHFKEVA